MNFKLNNEARNSPNSKRRDTLTVKEERQRTGRYIAILVGILLFLLAIYHAWVRRIPFIASLVVPAIIMFVYVGWVLYTASRDKHRALDAEAQDAAALQQAENVIANVYDVAIITSSETSKNDPEASGKSDWAGVSSMVLKTIPKNHVDVPQIVKPIILVNDKPLVDFELTSQTVALDVSLNTSRFKVPPSKRRFKRRFCRSKKYAAFKRSYSIA